MGLFLRQDENRSQLQSKIVKDLQKKIAGQSNLENDKVVEPALLENQHTTRTPGVVIAILLFVLTIAVIVVIVKSQ